jgi:hypothetical protein
MNQEEAEQLGWVFANSDIEEGLVVEADVDHDMRRKHTEERHQQHLRHREEFHKQHMRHVDEVHKHNLNIAKEHHKHLSPAYLYGGGMAYNAPPDHDADDRPGSGESGLAAPATGTQAGATTGGAGGTAGGAASGTGGGAA